MAGNDKLTAEQMASRADVVATKNGLPDTVNDDADGDELAALIAQSVICNAALLEAQTIRAQQGMGANRQGSDLDAAWKAKNSGGGNYRG